MKNKKKTSDNIDKTIIKEDKFYANFYLLFFSLLPIIYSDVIIDPVLLPRQLFLTIFLVVLLIKIFFQKENLFLFGNQLFNRIVFIGLSGFSLVTLAATFFSFSKTEASYVTSKYLIEIVYLLLTFFLLANKKISLIILQKAILLFTSVTVLISYYQILTIYGNGGELLHNIEINSTAANKNLLSSILYLSLPFIVGFLITQSTTKLWKFFAMFNFISILSILYILQTKTVFIAFVGFVLCFLFLLILFKLIKKVKFLFSLSMVIATSLLVIFSFVFSIYLINKEQIFQRVSITPAKTDMVSDLEKVKEEVVTSDNVIGFVKINSVHTFDLRLSLWNNTIQMYKDHPIIGVGPGNWQIFFPKYGLNKIDEISTRDGHTTYQRPHNDWLWILSELGIFGLFFYLLVIFFSVIYLLSNSFIIEKNSMVSINLLFVSSLFGYIFIYFADFPLERIEHQLLFYTIIAYSLFNKVLDLSPVLKVVNHNKIYLFILFFIICIYSFVVSTSRLSGEKHTRLLKIAHMQSDWNTMISEASIAKNIFYQLDPMSIPIDWYKGVALFSLNNFSSALISFQNAYHQHPYNIHVINDLASCHEKLKQHDKAVIYYKKALTISTGFDEARLNLCAVYFNTNRYKSAFFELKKCDSLTQNPKYKLFLPSITKKYLNLTNLSDTTLTRLFHNYNQKRFMKLN